MSDQWIKHDFRKPEIDPLSCPGVWTAVLLHQRIGWVDEDVVPHAVSRGTAVALGVVTFICTLACSSSSPMPNACFKFLPLFESPLNLDRPVLSCSCSLSAVVVVRRVDISFFGGTSFWCRCIVESWIFLAFDVVNIVRISTGWRFSTIIVYRSFWWLSSGGNRYCWTNQNKTRTKCRLAATSSL